MHGALLAVVHPDNTPHGANLTFAIPILVFVIVAAALFLRFRAPHTVPGHAPLKSSRWASAGEAGKAAFGTDAVDSAVGVHAEPVEEPGPADAQATAPGTVQSGTAAPEAGTGGQTATSEQAAPAQEGTEDSE